MSHNISGVGAGVFGGKNIESVPQNNEPPIASKVQRQSNQSNANCSQYLQGAHILHKSGEQDSLAQGSEARDEILFAGRTEIIELLQSLLACVHQPFGNVRLRYLDHEP